MLSSVGEIAMFWAAAVAERQVLALFTSHR